MRFGGATRGEIVFNMFVHKKYLLTNHRTWKVDIYMEAFRHTVHQSLFE
jgi:hypothetical protein